LEVEKKTKPTVKNLHHWREKTIRKFRGGRLQWLPAIGVEHTGGKGASGNEEWVREFVKGP